MIIRNGGNTSARHKRLDTAFAAAAKAWAGGDHEITIISHSGVKYQLARTSDGLYGCLAYGSTQELQPNQAYWDTLAERYGLPRVQFGIWKRLD